MTYRNCDRYDCDLIYSEDWQDDAPVYSARCKTCGAEFSVSAEEALDAKEEDDYDEPEDDE